ncbi:MAG: hypothetical protein ACRCZE_02880 [Candidatus Altimarinota bacterium]
MSQLLNRFKLSNHQVFVLFLFIYSLTAIFFHPAAWASLLLILATGLIYFIFNQKVLHHKKNFWNTLISLLIIFLTWHYSSDLNGFLLTGLVVLTTLSLKYFLQYKGCSITNPAATGLLLVTLLNDFFQISELSFVSWWGASFSGYVSLALIAIWLLLGVGKWTKFPIIITFLIPHFILSYFLKGQEYFLYMIQDATIYFYLAIMLIDPKSSPIKKNEQIIYALVALISWHLLQYLNIPNYELWSIIIANFYHLFTRYLLMKKAKPAL